MKKEIKEYEISRPEKRIKKYQEKYEILNEISYDLFIELDENCELSARNIHDEFTKEFKQKMNDCFDVSEVIQKINLKIGEFKNKKIRRV